MLGNAIIDLDTDPLATPAERRRRAFRVGVPIVGVLLMILVILAIAVYAQNANRAGALLLSDEILATLDARIGEQVAAYFGPARRGVVIARDLLADGQPEQREPLFEKFAISALKEIPQLDSLNLGDGDGNFVMVIRNPATAGIDRKFVHNGAGRREVFWIRRDRDGAQTAREVVPNDDYVLEPGPGSRVRSRPTRRSGPTSIRCTPAARRGLPQPCGFRTPAPPRWYSAQISP